MATRTWVADQSKAGACKQGGCVLPSHVPAALPATSGGLSAHTGPVTRAYLSASGLGDRRGLRGHRQPGRRGAESGGKRRAVPQVLAHLPPRWRWRLRAAGGGG